MRETKRQMVDDWNAKYRAGQDVVVKTSTRKTLKTKTSSPAFLLGGHTPVIHLEGTSGYYSLDRITAV